MEQCRGTFPGPLHCCHVVESLSSGNMGYTTVCAGASSSTTWWWTASPFTSTTASPPCAPRPAASATVALRLPIVTVSHARNHDLHCCCSARVRSCVIIASRNVYWDSSGVLTSTVALLQAHGLQEGPALQRQLRAGDGAVEPALRHPQRRRARPQVSVRLLGTWPSHKPAH